MSRPARALSTVICCLPLACGPAIELGNGEASSSSGEPGSTDGGTHGNDGPGTDSTPGSSSDSSDPDEGDEVDSGGPGCTFTCPDPPPPPPGSTTGGGGPFQECSLLEQDCPDGEKCMPWANDGGMLWNATRCSPLAEEPNQYGQPCYVEGSGFSGIDTCAHGLMCFDVDPRTNEGECAALCTGLEGDPVDALLCDDPDLTCIVINDVLPLCAQDCDPVDPDCEEGDACFLHGEGFTCGDVPDSAANEGDPCASTTGCGAGLMCAYGPAFECEAEPGQGCCAAVCDATAPDSCAVGECIPWFPDPAPEGTEHVGVCGTA